jgi:hypothetical protein
MNRGHVQLGGSCLLLANQMPLSGFPGKFVNYSATENTTNIRLSSPNLDRREHTLVAFLSNYVDGSLIISISNTSCCPTR